MICSSPFFGFLPILWGVTLLEKVPKLETLTSYLFVLFLIISIKVVTIFLRVPKDELQKRLESRIDKPSPKEIQLRLNRFDFEESKIGIYDYVIKNNDLEKTVSIIQKIIEEEANVKNTEF